MSQEQLSTYNTSYNFYKKYHSNLGNIFVHIICIPILVWSIFGISNKLGELLSLNQNLVTRSLPSLLIYLSYMTYYYIIAPNNIFYQTALFYLIILVHLNSFYRNKYSLLFYTLVHIGGWVIQILSHKYLEGNSPALLSGIVQSFLTAPIFIVQELVDNINFFNLTYPAITYLSYKLLF